MNNKLIWGDNKLILSSLKNGPMRKEIEAQGGLKLIYIDPPFDVGADFSMDIEIGEGESAENFTKKPSVIEEIAYRDTWGKGADSFIAMIYERLKLMHDLLAEDGSIYVHCDWRLSGYMKIVLDEIFGKDNFQNEIIWHYKNSALKAKSKKFRQNTDTILYYVKEKGKHIWNDVFEKCEPYKNSKHKFNPTTKKAERVKNEQGKIEYFMVDKRKCDNLIQINALNSNEKVGYPTQKPKELIKRFVLASSNENDVVADYYLGSGTTAVVCKELNRNFIGCDINPKAIEITNARLDAVS